MNKTDSIESIYDGIFDLTTPLDDLLREKQNLQQRINVINKEIQRLRMIKLEEKEVINRKVLIITETDDIQNIIPKIVGERFSIVFIHKDNQNIDRIKRMIELHLYVNGKIKGNIYLYEDSFEESD